LEETLARYVVPALIVAAGGIVGLAVDRIIVSRVRSSSARNGWRGGEATARALSGIPAVLGILIGVWIAADGLELSERASGYVDTALRVAAITVITVLATRLAASLTRLYTSRDDAVVPSSSIFVNIVRIFVVALGLIFVLNALGVQIGPLLAALGVGGLALALALQDTLSNLFSGLQLIGSRQISPGEYISLETGEEGYVEDMTWRFTTIRQLSNNLVVVPNAILAASRIINYHKPVHEMSVLVPVGVAYGSDLELVERITIETAAEVIARVEGPIEGFEPMVRFHTFGDSAIEFNVVLRVKEYVNQHILRHEFVKALAARYAAEGIEIPYPQRTVTFAGQDHMHARPAEDA
jgi:small-conductance mechanosensitive channel